MLWGWTLVQVYTDALALLWGCLLLLCMVLRVRSGFVALLWVLCPSTAGLLRHLVGANWNGNTTTIPVLGRAWVQIPRELFIG